MLLQPGVMRELHWHATAAEWAYIVKGNVRTTVIDPYGLDDFGRATSGTFCAGTGMSSNSRSTRSNGLSERHVQHHRLVGHAPKRLLAKNFGLPETVGRLEDEAELGNRRR